MAHRRAYILLPLLMVCGCAPLEEPARQAAPIAVPTAQDISNAMAHSMTPIDEGGWMCAIVSDIQCSPVGRPGRLHCSFEHQGKRREAVLERTGRTEWERMGQWRWVRGWRSCGWYF